ncbi:MAG: phage holin family protein [Puniceicoccaceae bacterium]|nr:MAG: phage holin family protein [Puniceicoccaceae bacterium]
MHPLLVILVRMGITALGVVAAASLLTGIRYEDGTTLILVALVLSFFNAILRPVLIFLALPFVLLTLGVGILLINALLLLLTAWLVPGFEVDGFWWGLGAALVISFISLLAGTLLRGRPMVSVQRHPPRRGGRGRDDVIDI